MLAACKLISRRLLLSSAAYVLVAGGEVAHAQAPLLRETAENNAVAGAINPLGSAASSFAPPVDSSPAAPSAAATAAGSPAIGGSLSVCSDLDRSRIPVECKGTFQ